MRYEVKLNDNITDIRTDIVIDVRKGTSLVTMVSKALINYFENDYADDYMETHITKLRNKHRKNLDDFLKEIEEQLDVSLMIIDQV